jgi:CBS domain-containing protein
MKTVGDVMTRRLPTLAGETPLGDAAATMTERRVGSALVGIVSIRDLMRVAPEDVSPRGV